MEFEDTDTFVRAAGEVVLDQDAEIIYLRDGQRYTGTVRFMPWNSVYVEDDDLEDLDDDDDGPRRVGRPDLDDVDDAFDD
jgi:hypothetical protein